MQSEEEDTEGNDVRVSYFCFKGPAFLLVVCRSWTCFRHSSTCHVTLKYVATGLEERIKIKLREQTQQQREKRPKEKKKKERDADIHRK